MAPAALMSDTSGSLTMAQARSLTPLHQNLESEKQPNGLPGTAGCNQDAGATYDTGKAAWSTVAGAYDFFI